MVVSQHRARLELNTLNLSVQIHTGFCPFHNSALTSQVLPFLERSRAALESLHLIVACSGVGWQFKRFNCHFYHATRLCAYALISLCPFYPSTLASPLFIEINEFIIYYRAIGSAPGSISSPNYGVAGVHNYPCFYRRTRKE